MISALAGLVGLGVAWKLSGGPDDFRDATDYFDWLYDELPVGHAPYDSNIRRWSVITRKRVFMDTSDCRDLSDALNEMASNATTKSEIRTTAKRHKLFLKLCSSPITPRPDFVPEKTQAELVDEALKRARRSSPASITKPAPRRRKVRTYRGPRYIEDVEQVVDPLEREDPHWQEMERRDFLNPSAEDITPAEEAIYFKRRKRYE